MAPVNGCLSYQNAEYVYNHNDKEKSNQEENGNHSATDTISQNNKNVNVSVDEKHSPDKKSRSYLPSLVNDRNAIFELASERSKKCCQRQINSNDK